MNVIETKYCGHLFRSRLEARWAVFFNALGIEWEYEKEGYHLNECGNYLPDFYLNSLDCFVEIKPLNLWDVRAELNSGIRSLMREFANSVSPIICFGGLPGPSWNGMLFCLDITDSSNGEYSEQCGFDWCHKLKKAVISVSDSDILLLHGSRKLFKPGYIEWRSPCLNRRIGHIEGCGHTCYEILEASVEATSARFEYSRI